MKASHLIYIYIRPPRKVVNEKGKFKVVCIVTVLIAHSPATRTGFRLNSTFLLVAMAQLNSSQNIVQKLAARGFTWSMLKLKNKAAVRKL